MQISTRGASNRVIRTAPVSPKTYRGGNPALGWVRHSASPTLYDLARLASRCAATVLRPWRSEFAVGNASLGSPMCRSRRTNGLPTMAQDVPAVRQSSSSPTRTEMPVAQRKSTPLRPRGTSNSICTPLGGKTSRGCPFALVGIITASFGEAFCVKAFLSCGLDPGPRPPQRAPGRAWRSGRIWNRLAACCEAR